MVVNQKVTGRASSMPGGLAFGAAISVGLTLLIAGILTWLVSEEKLAWENIGYGIMVLLLISSFAGALAAYGRIKRQRMLVCGIAGVVYFGILLSLTALFFGGQYDGMPVTALLILGGSAAAGLLGLGGNRGGKRRKVSRSHR